MSGLLVFVLLPLCTDSSGPFYVCLLLLYMFAFKKVSRVTTGIDFVVGF